MTDAVECPLCGVAYPRARIEAHAATCDGTVSPQPRAEKRPKTADGAAAAADAAEDADFQFALRLQAELDAEAAQAYTCGLCHNAVPVSSLYILDVCPFLSSKNTHTHETRMAHNSYIHTNRSARTGSAGTASAGTWPRRWRRA